MSSSTLSLKTPISYSNLKCASRGRRYCRPSTASLPPQQQLHLHLQKLGHSSLPSAVVLESHFSPPTSKWDIHDCPRLATGFFLDPTLIATSIHAVARTAPSHGGLPHEYTAEIARTIAFTHHGSVMTTRPLAVNFAGGVAVLEVVLQSASEAPPPRGCALAESPPGKDDIILTVARHQSLGLAMMIGNVRGGGAAAERSVQAEAPWPLDDGLGWIEHGWFGVGDCGPAPGSSGALCEASVSKIMGSPWFNLQGEVVGVSSWEVKDESDEFLVGFAAPAASIRAVADYVRTKGADDPVVMDSWISAHVFYGD